MRSVAQLRQHGVHDGLDGLAQQAVNDVVLDIHVGGYAALVSAIRCTEGFDGGLHQLVAVDGSALVSKSNEPLSHGYLVGAVYPLVGGEVVPGVGRVGRGGVSGLTIHGVKTVKCVSAAGSVRVDTGVASDAVPGVVGHHYSSSESLSRCLFLATYRESAGPIAAVHITSPLVSAMRFASMKSSGCRLNASTKSLSHAERSPSPTCPSKSSQLWWSSRTRAMNIFPGGVRGDMARTLSGSDSGGDMSGHTTADVMAPSVAMKRLADNGQHGYCYGHTTRSKLGATHRRHDLAEETAVGFETTRRGVSPMSMTATASQRTSLILSDEDHADLQAPTCSRHWRAAVGVVTWEIGGDHERREPFCPRCAWDVMSEALLARPFSPPVVSALDMCDVWAVSA